MPFKSIKIDFEGTIKKIKASQVVNYNELVKHINKAFPLITKYDLFYQDSSNQMIIIQEQYDFQTMQEELNCQSIKIFIKNHKNGIPCQQKSKKQIFSIQHKNEEQKQRKIVKSDQKIHQIIDKRQFKAQCGECQDLKMYFFQSNTTVDCSSCLNKQKLNNKQKKQINPQKMSILVKSNDEVERAKQLKKDISFTYSQLINDQVIKRSSNQGNNHLEKGFLSLMKHLQHTEIKKFQM